MHSTNALSASVAPLLLPAPWESESPDSFTATAAGGSGGYTYSWEWAYVSTSSVLEPTPNSWAAVVGSALAPTFTGGSTRTIGRVDPDPLSFDIDRFFRMRCRVQDSNGASVYTPTVRIGLPPALSASVSPNTLNATGSNRSLTCTAGGGASPYNYQWQRRIGNGAWADYSSSQASGETSRTIQFGNSQVLVDSWEFRCEVTDDDGTVAYTTSVPVTSIPALVVSARPTTIPETGTSRSLFCETAGGSTPYSWQWQRRIGSGAWADYSSSQASGETAQQMFIFNSLTLGLTWEFRCEVTDDDGTVAYTNEVTVEDVVISLSATVSPNSLPETGSNRSTTCTARNGSGGYSYQWQVNTGSGFADYNSSNATGETTATLRFNDSYTIPTGWSFRCEVTDSDNTIVVSNEVFIDDVAPPPVTDIHGDTPGSATFISANSNTAGQINPENDVDYFRFSVSAAGRITISTSGAANLDGRLENASNTPLVTDTDGTQVNIARDIAAGTYYIRLVERGDAGNFTGTYNLSVSFVEDVIDSFDSNYTYTAGRNYPIVNSTAIINYFFYTHGLERSFPHGTSTRASGSFRVDWSNLYIAFPRSDGRSAVAQLVMRPASGSDVLLADIKMSPSGTISNNSGTQTLTFSNVAVPAHFTNVFCRVSIQESQPAFGTFPNRIVMTYLRWAITIED